MAPQKIIIDTDPGVDDVLAILLALSSPEVDLTLISIVFGNTHAPVAYQNLLKIYYQLAQEITAIPEAASRYERLNSVNGKTKLSLGEDGPVGGDKAVAAYFHGIDGLSNISETHPHFTPEELAHGATHDHLEICSKPSHEAILDVLEAEPEGTVTIVALGPLTNLAHAYQMNPKVFARVHTVVWMGGALDHPGNTSPTSEFNCFADPYAASQIIEACKSSNPSSPSFPLILCPLDITTPHQIPFDDLIQPESSSPLRQFISAMLVRVRGLQESFGLEDAMEMHDPVAVWYAIEHAGLGVGEIPRGWEVKGREFKVERIGEITRGMCVVDRRGTGDDGESRVDQERLKAKDVSKGRMGEDVVVPKRLPGVVVGTPGKEALRSLLLSRVFGNN